MQNAWVSLEIQAIGTVKKFGDIFYHQVLR